MSESDQRLPLPDKNWLSIEDIYEYFSGTVPVETIRSWVRSGKLPGYQPGKVYLIWRDDFMKFVKDSRIKTDSQTSEGDKK